MISTELFRSHFKDVTQIIDDYLKSMTVDFVRNHFMELLSFSIQGGKMTRGILTASIYCELLNIDPSSAEAYTGYILGWAFEILQGAYLVADDLMDHSKTRRGQPCWYLRPDVGNSAVNDALIIENLVFVLINSLRDGKHLKPEIVDDITTELRKVIICTTMGQSFDTKCKSYNFECYRVIVENKTSLYSFLIPIITGIIATNLIPREKWTSDVFRDFILRTGFYFQAQDDWLDVYGDSKITGKIGSDIMEGKVTWLACTAFANANEKQKGDIMTNIGKDDEESQKKVKAVYDEIGICQMYQEFAEKENSYLNEVLSKLDEMFPKKTLRALLNKLLQRKS